jgi:hypothetical protein
VNKMAELREFGKSGPRVTFTANEGNMTITWIDTIAGMIPGPVFQSPLVKSDGITPGVYVKLSDDMEVQACAAGDTDCIGKTVDRPQFKGQQPIASKTWGNYTPRIVTVELFGSAVEMVDLEAANTAVTFGNYIKPGATTAQKFDKSSTATNKIALESAGASSGAKIAVLFGWNG